MWSIKYAYVKRLYLWTILFQATLSDEIPLNVGSTEKTKLNNLKKLFHDVTSSFQEKVVLFEKLVIIIILPKTS